MRLFTPPGPWTISLSRPPFHRHNAGQIPDISRLVGRKVDYSDRLHSLHASGQGDEFQIGRVARARRQLPAIRVLARISLEI